MRVGYLVETPITMEKRLFGAQISFIDLLSELSKRGVEPFVVVSEEWELTDILRMRGISYLVTPIWEFFNSLDGAYKEVHNADLQREQNPASEKSVEDYFRANDVELVHMNTRFCGLIGARVAALLQIPYIFHIREFLADDFGLAFRDEEAANRLIGGSSSLIAVSNSIGRHLSALYPDTRIDTIYNGVDIAKYSCDPQLRFGGECVRLAIVGRIIEHKGQFDAIRAVEALIGTTQKAIELLVVGHRPDEMTDYEKFLVTYVREHQLAESVSFFPYTDKVEDILETCDIGLMCSAMEAFGRVTVEYMLSQLLVIGADAGGTAEIVSHGENGLLYPRGDFRRLAQYIRSAIENPDTANRMIRAGNAEALSRYSMSRNSEEVFGIYQDILGL
ncbi:glycosyltransferase family 4 protein [Nocardia sp. NPDC003999]